MNYHTSNTTYYQTPYIPPAPTPVRYLHPRPTTAHPSPAIVQPTRRSRHIPVVFPDPQRTNQDGVWKISAGSDCRPRCSHSSLADSQKTLLGTGEKEQVLEEPDHQLDFAAAAAATTSQHVSFEKDAFVGHPSSSNRNVETAIVQQSHRPTAAAAAKLTRPKPATDALLNKTKAARRITVKSVNKGYRVWIDVAPNETGASLAHKIHTIATFRTQRVISIKTASGREVTLDKSPVFATWAELQNFQDGETWDVEWVRAERSSTMAAMSRFLFSSSSSTNS